MSYELENNLTCNTGKIMRKPDNEILIYANSDGNIKVDVRLEDETVWLSKAHMAQLFGKSRSTVTEHIANIFKEGELKEELVCRKFRHATSTLYNLNVRIVIKNVAQASRLSIFTTETVVLH